jgi:ribosomal protein S18 acetylase RimI-like enzyme
MPPPSPPERFTLHLIDPAHPLYPAELELRFRVLREPLGQPRESVRFPFEAHSLHLVAVPAEGAQQEVAGCVLFHPDSPPGAPPGGRLFQMAVRPELQGQGLGARLVRHLEAELRARGVSRVHLHARASVVPFYERLGYASYGDPFVEVGIPHRHMQRTL